MISNWMKTPKLDQIRINWSAKIWGWGLPLFFVLLSLTIGKLGLCFYRLNMFKLGFLQHQQQFQVKIMLPTKRRVWMSFVMSFKRCLSTYISMYQHFFSFSHELVMSRYFETKKIIETQLLLFSRYSCTKKNISNSHE